MAAVVPADLDRFARAGSRRGGGGKGVSRAREGCAPVAARCQPHLCAHQYLPWTTCASVPHRPHFSTRYRDASRGESEKRGRPPPPGSGVRRRRKNKGRRRRRRCTPALAAIKQSRYRNTNGAVNESHCGRAHAINQKSSGYIIREARVGGGSPGNLYYLHVHKHHHNL
jgi:hypothetical protein